MSSGKESKEEVNLSTTIFPSQEVQPPMPTDDDEICQRSISAEPRTPNPQYVKGWRLHVLTFA